MIILIIIIIMMSFLADDSITNEHLNADAGECPATSASLPPSLSLLLSLSLVIHTNIHSSGQLPSGRHFEALIKHQVCRGKVSPASRPGQSISGQWTWSIQCHRHVHHVSYSTSHSHPFGGRLWRFNKHSFGRRRLLLPSPAAQAPSAAALHP